MTSRDNFSAGFTLIELLITIAIVAIAMAIAVPSMSAFVRNAELTSTANSLLASLNTARSEAMKRAMNAMVVPIDATNWSQGWIVFVDKARNGNPNDSTNIIVMRQDALPSYFAVSGPAGFKFDASGFAITNNGTVSVVRQDVSGAEQLRETRRVKVGNTGRVRICTPTSTTDTECTSSTSSD